MKRTELQELPVFFDRYILKVPDIPLIQSLYTYEPSAILADLEKLEILGQKVYAPDKWTVNEILQHIIDNERIMSYRALRFARLDKTELPGYDQDLFVFNSTANNRSLSDLMKEWSAVRASTILLFESFGEKELIRTGKAFASDISVAALGFVIVGHAIWHREILDQRYLPLLQN